MWEILDKLHTFLEQEYLGVAIIKWINILMNIMFGIFVGLLNAYNILGVRYPSINPLIGNYSTGTVMVECFIIFAGLIKIVNFDTMITAGLSFTTQTITITIPRLHLHVHVDESLISLYYWIEQNISDQNNNCSNSNPTTSKTNFMGALFKWTIQLSVKDVDICLNKIISIKSTGITIKRQNNSTTFDVANLSLESHNTCLVGLEGLAGSHQSQLQDVVEINLTSISLFITNSSIIAVHELLTRITQVDIEALKAQSQRRWEKLIQRLDSIDTEVPSRNKNTNKHSPSSTTTNDKSTLIQVNANIVGINLVFHEPSSTAENNVINVVNTSMQYKTFINNTSGVSTDRKVETHLLLKVTDIVNSSGVGSTTNENSQVITIIYSTEQMYDSSNNISTATATAAADEVRASSSGPSLSVVIGRPKLSVSCHAIENVISLINIVSKCSHSYYLYSNYVFCDGNTEDSEILRSNVEVTDKANSCILCVRVQGIDLTIHRTESLPTVASTSYSDGVTITIENVRVDIEDKYTNELSCKVGAVVINTINSQGSIEGRYLHNYLTNDSNNTSNSKRGCIVLENIEFSQLQYLNASVPNISYADVMNESVHIHTFEDWNRLFSSIVYDLTDRRSFCDSELNVISVSIHSNQFDVSTIKEVLAACNTKITPVNLDNNKYDREYQSHWKLYNLQQHLCVSKLSIALQQINCKLEYYEESEYMNNDKLVKSCVYEILRNQELTSDVTSLGGCFTANRLVLRHPLTVFYRNSHTRVQYDESNHKDILNTTTVVDEEKVLIQSLQTSSTSSSSNKSSQGNLQNRQKSSFKSSSSGQHMSKNNSKTNIDSSAMYDYERRESSKHINNIYANNPVISTGMEVNQVTTFNQAFHLNDENIVVGYETTIMQVNLARYSVTFDFDDLQKLLWLLSYESDFQLAYNQSQQSSEGTTSQTTDIRPEKHDYYDQVFNTPTYALYLSSPKIRVTCRHLQQLACSLQVKNFELSQTYFASLISQLSTSFYSLQLLELTQSHAIHKRVISDIAYNNHTNSNNQSNNNNNNNDNSSSTSSGSQMINRISFHATRRRGEAGTFDLQGEYLKIIYLQRATMTLWCYFQDYLFPRIYQALSGREFHHKTLPYIVKPVENYDYSHPSTQQYSQDSNSSSSTAVYVSSKTGDIDTNTTNNPDTSNMVKVWYFGIYRVGILLKKCELHLPLNSRGTDALTIIFHHLTLYRAAANLEAEAQQMSYCKGPLLGKQLWLSELTNTRVFVQRILSINNNKRESSNNLLRIRWKLPETWEEYKYPSSYPAIREDTTIFMHINLSQATLCSWCNSNAICHRQDIHCKIGMVQVTPSLDNQLLERLSLEEKLQEARNTLIVEIRSKAVDWTLAEGQYWAIINLIQQNFSELQELVDDLYDYPKDKCVDLGDKVYLKYALEAHLPILSTVPIYIDKGRIIAAENEPDYYERFLRMSKQDMTVDEERLAWNEDYFMTDNIPAYSYHHKHRDYCMSIWQAIASNRRKQQQQQQRGIDVVARKRADSDDSDEANEAHQNHHMYRHNSGESDDGEDVTAHFSILFEHLEVDFYRRHFGGGSGIEVAAQSIMVVANDDADEDEENARHQRDDSSIFSNRFDDVDVKKILFAPKYSPLLTGRTNNNNANSTSAKNSTANNIPSKPTVPHMRYSQQTNANLRRCVVNVADSVVVGHFATIMAIVSFFNKPVNVTNDRNLLVIERKGIDELDYKAALDVEVHLQDCIITLPNFAPNSDETSALNFALNLTYLHAWRGFQFSGPGKAIFSVNAEVLGMFIAPLHDIGNVLIQTLVEAMEVEFTTDFTVLAMKSDHDKNLALLQPWINFSNDILRVNRSNDRPGATRYMTLRLNSCKQPSKHKTTDGDNSDQDNDSDDDEDMNNNDNYNDVSGSIRKKSNRIQSKFSLQDVQFVIKAIALLRASIQRQLSKAPKEDPYAAISTFIEDMKHVPDLSYWLVHTKLIPGVKADYKQLSFDIDDFDVCIRNNTYNMNIMRLELYNIDAEYSRSPDHLNMVAGVEFSASTYNDDIDSWEPFIEPVKVGAIGATDTSKGCAHSISNANRIRIEVRTDPVELNASQQAIISLLQKVKLGDVVTTSSERLPPYKIFNELGIKLQFSIGYDGGMVVSNEVENTKVLPIEVSSLTTALNDYKMRRLYNNQLATTRNNSSSNHSSRHHHNNLRAQRKEYLLWISFSNFRDSYESKVPLSIDKVGISSFEMLETDSARNAPLNRRNTTTATVTASTQSSSESLQRTMSTLREVGIMHYHQPEEKDHHREKEKEQPIKFVKEIPLAIMEMKIKDDGVRELHLKSILSIRNSTSRVFQVAVRLYGSSAEVSLAPGKEWNVPVRFANPRASLFFRFDQRAQWCEGLSSLAQFIAAGQWGQPQRMKAHLWLCPEEQVLMDSTMTSQWAMLMRPESKATDLLNRGNHASSRGAIPVRYPTKDSIMRSRKLASSSSNHMGGRTDSTRSIDDLQLSSMSAPSTQSSTLKTVARGLAVPVCIYLQAPLLLSNFLPQPMMYRLVDSDGVTCAEGVILPGQVVDIHNLAKICSTKIFLSVRLINYGWSKWVVVCTRTNPYWLNEKLTDITLPPLTFKSSDRLTLPQIDITMCIKEYLVRFVSQVVVNNCTGLDLLLAESGYTENYIPLASNSKVEDFVGKTNTTKQYTKILKPKRMYLGVNIGKMLDGDQDNGDTGYNSEDSDEEDDEGDNASSSNFSSENMTRSYSSAENKYLRSDSFADARNLSPMNSFVGGNIQAISSVTNGPGQPPSANEAILRIVVYLPTDHCKKVEVVTISDWTLYDLFEDIRHLVSHVAVHADPADYLFFPYDISEDSSNTTSKAATGHHYNIAENLQEPDDELQTDTGSDTASVTSSSQRYNSSNTSPSKALKKANSSSSIMSNTSTSGGGLFDSLPQFMRFDMSHTMALDAPLEMSHRLRELSCKTLILVHQLEYNVYLQANNVTSEAVEAEGLLSSVFRRVKYTYGATFHRISGAFPFRTHRMLGFQSNVSLKVSNETDWSAGINCIRADFDVGEMVITVKSKDNSSTATASTPTNHNANNTANTGNTNTTSSNPITYYEFGAFIERGRGILSNTTIVTFVPKHVLISKLPYAIDIRQIQDNDNTLANVVELRGEGIQSYFFVDRKKAPLLQIRRQPPSNYNNYNNDSSCSIYEWQGELDICNLGIVYVKLRDPIVILKVETEIVGASLVATFSEQSLLWPPYKIANKSEATVRFKQSLDESMEYTGTTSTSADNTDSTNDTVLPWEVLSPRANSSFTWDYPFTGNKLLRIELAQGNQWIPKTISLDDDRKVEAFVIKKTAPNIGNPLAESVLSFRAVINNNSHNESNNLSTNLLNSTGFGSSSQQWVKVYCILRPDTLYVFEDESRSILAAVINLSTFEQEYGWKYAFVTKYTSKNRDSTIIGTINSSIGMLGSLITSTNNASNTSAGRNNNNGIINFDTNSVRRMMLTIGEFLDIFSRLSDDTFNMKKRHSDSDNDSDNDSDSDHDSKRSSKEDNDEDKKKAYNDIVIDNNDQDSDNDSHSDRHSDNDNDNDNESGSDSSNKERRKKHLSTSSNLSKIWTFGNEQDIDDIDNDNDNDDNDQDFQDANDDYVLDLDHQRQSSNEDEVIWKAIDNKRTNIPFQNIIVVEDDEEEQQEDSISTVVNVIDNQDNEDTQKYQNKLETDNNQINTSPSFTRKRKMNLREFLRQGVSVEQLLDELRNQPMYLADIMTAAIESHLVESTAQAVELCQWLISEKFLGTLAEIAAWRNLPSISSNSPDKPATANTVPSSTVLMAMNNTHLSDDDNDEDDSGDASSVSVQSSRNTFENLSTRDAAAQVAMNKDLSLLSTSDILAATAMHAEIMTATTNSADYDAEGSSSNLSKLGMSMSNMSNMTLTNNILTNTFNSVISHPTTRAKEKAKAMLETLLTNKNFLGSNKKKQLNKQRELAAFLERYGDRELLFNPPSLNPELIAAANETEDLLNSAVYGDDDDNFDVRRSTFISNNTNNNNPLNSNSDEPGFTIVLNNNYYHFKCSTEMEFLGWIQACRQSIELSWIDMELGKKLSYSSITMEDFQHNICMKVRADGSTKVLEITEGVAGSTAHVTGKNTMTQDFFNVLRGTTHVTSSTTHKQKETRASVLLPFLNRGKRLLNQAGTSTSLADDMDNIDRDQELISVSFTVQSVSLSLIDILPSEFLYIRLQDINMGVIRYFDAVQMFVTVHHIQLNNQLLAPNFPVALFPRKLLKIPAGKLRLPGYDSSAAKNLSSTSRTTYPTLHLYFQQRYHDVSVEAQRLAETMAANKQRANAGQVDDSNTSRKRSSTNPGPSTPAVKEGKKSAGAGEEDSELWYFDVFTIWLAPLQLAIEEELLVKLMRYIYAIRTAVLSSVDEQQPGTSSNTNNNTNTNNVNTNTNKKKQSRRLKQELRGLQSSRYLLGELDLKAVYEYFVRVLDSGRTTYENYQLNVKKSLNLYFGVLQLHPVDISFNFRPSPDIQVTNAETAIVSIISQLDNARICLNALIAEHAYGSTTIITEIVIKHYRAAFWRQFHRLIGAAEIVEGSVGLVANLGTGVYDLFYEPIEGLLDENSSFLDGLSRGGRSLAARTVGSASMITSTLTGGIGRGVSLLTLDSEFQRHRNFRRYNKANNVTQGLYVGTQELGKNIVEGVTGIVAAPIKGWETGGSVGFSMGIAKGLLGVALKPAVGVFDLASRAAEGMRAVAFQSNIPGINAEMRGTYPSRFSRAFGRAGQLRTYDAHAAAAQFMSDSLLGLSKEHRLVVVEHLFLVRQLDPRMHAHYLSGVLSGLNHHALRHKLRQSFSVPTAGPVGRLEDRLAGLDGDEHENYESLPEWRCPALEGWGMRVGQQYMVLVSAGQIGLLEIFPTNTNNNNNTNNSAHNTTHMNTPTSSASNTNLVPTATTTANTANNSSNLNPGQKAQKIAGQHRRFVWLCPAHCISQLSNDTRGDLVISLHSSLTLGNSVTAAMQAYMHTNNNTGTNTHTNTGNTNTNTLTTTTGSITSTANTGSITNTNNTNTNAIVLDTKMQSYVIFQSLLEQTVGARLARLQPLSPTAGLTQNQVKKRYSTGLRSYLMSATEHTYRLFGSVLYEYCHTNTSTTNQINNNNTNTNDEQQHTAVVESIVEDSVYEHREKVLAELFEPSLIEEKQQLFSALINSKYNQDKNKAKNDDTEDDNDEEEDHKDKDRDSLLDSSTIIKFPTNDSDDNYHDDHDDHDDVSDNDTTNNDRKTLVDEKSQQLIEQAISKLKHRRRTAISLRLKANRHNAGMDEGDGEISHSTKQRLSEIVEETEEEQEQADLEEDDVNVDTDVIDAVDDGDIKVEAAKEAKEAPDDNDQLVLQELKTDAIPDAEDQKAQETITNSTTADADEDTTISHVNEVSTDVDVRLEDIYTTPHGDINDIAAIQTTATDLSVAVDNIPMDYIYDSDGHSKKHPTASEESSEELVLLGVNTMQKTNSVDVSGEENNGVETEEVIIDSSTEVAIDDHNHDENVSSTATADIPTATNAAAIDSNTSTDKVVTDSDSSTSPAKRPSSGTFNTFLTRTFSGGYSNSTSVSSNSNNHANISSTSDSTNNHNSNSSNTSTTSANTNTNNTSSNNNSSSITSTNSARFDENSSLEEQSHFLSFVYPLVDLYIVGPVAEDKQQTQFSLTLARVDKQKMRVLRRDSPEELFHEYLKNSLHLIFPSYDSALRWRQELESRMLVRPPDTVPTAPLTTEEKKKAARTFISSMRGSYHDAGIIPESNSILGTLVLPTSACNHEAAEQLKIEIAKTISSAKRYSV